MCHMPPFEIHHLPAKSSCHSGLGENPSWSQVARDPQEGLGDPQQFFMGLGVDLLIKGV